MHSSTQALGVFEVDLHDLWYKLIAIAKVTPAKDAEADRIVAQVVRLRELGPLTHKDTGKETVMSNGQRLWSDLPFLEEDLYKAWTDGLHTMTPSQRENLAGFMTRLVGSNACGDGIASCALRLFRAALETSEESPSTDGPASEYLLSALFTWLYWGSFKIWKLSVFGAPLTPEARLNAMDSNWGDVGDLGIAAGVEEKGFIEKRLRFWITRLEGIAAHVAEKDSTLSDMCKWSAALLSQWYDTMNRG
ncbi:hypothetical protein VHEMI02713 [[Torrubiella] hemipterigena]|uniref:Uncharacterized protein n=1 Tax=[Torrubiella] hemipterigena TaxID=1531966 RepID=A0A0A1TBE8_9HYPO|nr:hypothetical protein VHEMI02713 [[Torrubiella] hemipterigena]